MKTLDIKVKRQLGNLKVQAITIGLVVASGVSIFISSKSAYDSLFIAREKFYSSSFLSQGFVTLKRAPEQIKKNLSNIEGIGALRTRIVNEVILDIPGEIIPTSAKFVSLTEGINIPYIRKGKIPTGENEVLISESFAIANKLGPGDHIVGVIEGKKKSLVISGTALSPEYVYIFRGSNPLPDDKHYGIIWMDREGMESSFGMKGAFNDAIFMFAPNANTRSVIKKIDRELEPYGGYGAFDRDKLVSHSFLKDEFRQLKSTAYTLPMIFLGVAAFLLHIVSTRIISNEREQIATLKALGYPNIQIAAHYLKLISSISGIGALGGVFLGIYLGRAMTDLYGDYYKFPKLSFYFDPFLGLEGFIFGITAGVVGAFVSIRNVLKLDPAQAMRPPIPIVFKKSIIEIFSNSLNARSKMILRNLTRRPSRTLVSITGISTSVMIMVLGLFSKDAFNAMLDIQFNLLQRESVTVTFLRPISKNSLNELKHYPGVISAEGYRTVPVRIAKGHRTKEIGLQGIPENAKLRRLIGKNREALIPPTTGIFLNSVVAKKLEIRTGDEIFLNVLEGNRKKIKVKVEGTIDEILGQGAYMEIDSVNRLIGEGDSVNLVALKIDPKEENNLLLKLKDVPKISGVSTRSAILKIFYETMSRSILATAMIILIFASVIAVGVIYNTAMISLSERSFELGSLRILGFTNNEVFGILAGELAIEIISSLPLGCILGYMFAYLMLSATQTEGFTVPLIISNETYGISILTAIVTSIISFGILYKKINGMDLISILKVRE